MILDGQWEVAICEISYPSMYQNVREDKFMYFDDKLSKTTEAYNLEPGLYFSISDIPEAMNTLIQESNSHRDTCITMRGWGRETQKTKVFLTNEESILAIFSTNLGHFLEGGVRIRETHAWESSP